MSEETVTGPKTDSGEGPTRQRTENGRRAGRKLTGPELEARVGSWISGRRRPPSEGVPSKRALTPRRVVLAGLAAALAGLLAYSGVTEGRHEQALLDRSARIQELEAAANGTDPADAPADRTAALTELSRDASASAQEVADKQNVFRGLYTDMGADVGPEGDGSPSPAMRAMIEHRRSLAGHWEEKALVATDETAYEASSVVEDPDGRIDPRFAWYVRHDGIAASDPSEYEWMVEAVSIDPQDPGMASVVWVNRQADGTVLAWASAVYSDGSGKFSRPVVVITDAGARHAQTPWAVDGGGLEGIEE